MSLHWTIIAGFLYAEIGFMLVLLLPFISTRMWHKVSYILNILEGGNFLRILVTAQVTVGKLRNCRVLDPDRIGSGTF
jgi:hypothetical protein